RSPPASRCPSDTRPGSRRLSRSRPSPQPPKSPDCAPARGTIIALRSPPTPANKERPMPGNTKRVFYVKYLASQDYAHALAQRPDVRLDRVENDSPDEVAAPVIEAAHAYQIGSARDELAGKFHATAALLARAPNLLIVSTNGAGYDTVNVKDCTQAGVL